LRTAVGSVVPFGGFANYGSSSCVTTTADSSHVVHPDSEGPGQV
jgi:hypothetical protein